MCKSSIIEQLEMRIARLERGLAKTGFTACDSCKEYVNYKTPITYLNGLKQFVCSYCEEYLRTNGRIK